MNSGHLRDIVILGGGAAGWIAAALLAKKIDCEQTRITLVESEQIGTIGVGEATVPILAQYNAMVGIDEFDFVRSTQGTFKLGIEFCDWGTAGNRHFHAFSDFGHPVEGISTHHYWLRLRQSGEDYPIEDYSFAYAVGKNNNFAPHNERYHYAYHFDAGLYARYLRDVATELGVQRIEGKMTHFDLDPESGNISAIHLADGQTIPGDFFLDCTGFASELLGKALDTPFVDWSHWLLCNSAIAVPSTRIDTPMPFTRSTAHAGGWRWTIPLQHRNGNGMVYSSDYWSDDAARDELLGSISSEPLAEPRLFRFTSGHRKQFWNRNCVGIGFASSFLEPLESTGIQLIVMGVLKLLRYFPQRVIDPVLRNEYNRLSTIEIERIRDFIIAHYYLSRRPEPLWAACRNIEIPDSLRHKIEIWKASGQIPLGDLESYMEPSWVAILLGNNLVPSRYSVSADKHPLDQIRNGMKLRREEIVRSARAVTSHRDFIDGHCKAVQLEFD
ncbi:tryptophan halogenase [Sphingobium sp. AEW010]|nr:MULTISPECIES: tryptophan halogenase family protein [unclassified Sphingobium]PSO11667.1 tryptophan halogenase [Sphingobium sp. AEW4]TWD07808.1 tryptophan halogenase [Sphingobium sp. AEW010]TWD24922.1 tryptophan halogenase [Sphingobium sp. AEW013]TWD26660.1 tryptophan halogenase [Sphingobium sp. AEW001]